MRIRGDSAGLEGDLSGAQTMIDNSLKSIAAGAASLLGTVAAFGRGIFREGLAAAGEFEKTTVEMETMIGSAEETQKTLADLTKFAVETPFEMPQLLQVTQGLIQFGERGDELMETIKILGDASGGTASKFGLLGLVFNQIRGVGKLLTQDFRQLSTRGIISLQDIAKHYKVTTNEAQKMLSSGKVSFEDFKKILKELTSEGGRFANMMIKQSATLTGLQSTLSDAINIAKRGIAVPLVPFAKALTTAMIQLANATEAFVRNGGAMVSFGFAGATAFSVLGASIFGATLALKLLGMTWSKFFLGLVYAVPIIALGAAVGMLVGWLAQSKTVMDSVSASWQIFSSYIDMAADSFNAFVSEHYSELTAIRDLFVEVMGNLEETIGNFVIAAGEMFGQLWMSFTGSTKGMTETLLDWVRDSLDWLSLMSTDWTLTWELIKTNVAIILMKIADTALVAWNTIGAGVLGLGAYIGSVFSDTWALITGIWQVGIDTLAYGWDTMINGFKIAWVSFKDLVIQAIVAILKPMSEWAESLSKILYLSGVINLAQREQFKAMPGQIDKIGKESSKSKEKEMAEIAEAQRQRDLAFEETDSLTDVVGRYAQVGANAARAYDAAFAANMGADSPLKGTIDVLTKDADRIKSQMIDIREDRRKKRKDEEEDAARKELERHAGRGGVDFKGKGKIGGAAGPDIAKAFDLKEGRYGFQDIGTKIQDSLLGKDKDTGQKQVDLAQQGLEKQDELLKATRDNKPGPAKLG